MRIPRNRLIDPIVGSGSAASARDRLARFGLRLLLAFGVTVAAAILTLAVPPFRGQSHFLLFAAAVVLATWYGGLFAGLAATALGMAASVYIIGLGRLEQNLALALQLGLFAIVALILIGLMESRQQQMRVARRLAILVESSQDAIIGMDLYGTITSWNAGAAQMYGYSAAEMLGQSISILMPPGRENEVLEHIERLQRGEALEMYETVRQRKDGAQVDIAVRLSPIRDEAGRMVGASAIARDITARRRAQEALRESEERFRAVLDNSIDVAYRRNLQTDRYDYMSPAIAGISGFTVEEFSRMGMDEVLERIHPDDRPRVEREIERTLHGGVPFANIEYRFRAQDGSYHWFADNINVIKDRQGVPLYRVGNIRDITHHHEIEAALRASEERFRLALENIPDVIVIYDRDLRIQYINPATRRTTGRPVSEFIGRREEEIWPESYRLWQPALRAAFDTGHVQTLALDFDGPVGRRNLIITCVPLRDEAGVVREVMGITQDVTEQKHAQRRLAEALERERLLRQEAETASELRDQFISIASHELRTPLTSAVGYAELLNRRLIEGATVGPEERRMLGTIFKQTARLNRMIADLLDISRLEKGQLELDRQAVDLGAVVEAVVQEWRPTGHRHRIELEVQPSNGHGPVMVHGDAIRLHQVFQNLLQNAIKYSPYGGDVRVTVKRVGDRAQVTVADQGIGIPQEARGQLFQRFYRAPNSEAFHISGLGVGLYVVREIVRLHGGEIGFDSEEGRGTTFTVSLPLVSMAAQC